MTDAGDWIQKKLRIIAGAFFVFCSCRTKGAGLVKNGAQTECEGNNRNLIFELFYSGVWALGIRPVTWA